MKCCVFSSCQGIHVVISLPLFYANSLQLSFFFLPDEDFLCKFYGTRKLAQQSHDGRQLRNVSSKCSFQCFRRMTGFTEIKRQEISVNQVFRIQIIRVGKVKKTDIVVAIHSQEQNLLDRRYMLYFYVFLWTFRTLFDNIVTYQQVR